MPVTMTLPDAVHDKLDKRTSETSRTDARVWLSAQFACELQRLGCRWFVPRLSGEGPFKDVYSVMAAWGANHGAVCYGIYTAVYIPQPRRRGLHHPGQHVRFAKRPVCMHNVDPAKIQRPSYWNAAWKLKAAITGRARRFSDSMDAALYGRK
jgi:L-fucose isomerase